MQVRPRLMWPMLAVILVCLSGSANGQDQDPAGGSGKPRISIGGGSKSASTDDPAPSKVTTTPTDVDSQSASGTGSSATGAAPPTEDELKAVTDQVMQLAEDDASRDPLLKELGLARQAVTDGTKQRDDAGPRRNAAGKVETAAADLSTEVGKLKDAPLPEIDKSKDVKQLELELDGLKTQLLEAERLKKESETEVESAPSVLKVWQEEAAKLPNQIANLQDAINALPGDLSPLQATVRSVRLRAELWKALQSQDFAAADIQFRIAAAAAKYFELKKEKATIVADRLKKQVTALQAAVAQIRQEKASQQMSDARAAQDKVDESLKPAAEQIEALALELRELSGKIENVEKRTTEAQDVITDWSDTKEKLENQIHVNALTEIVGLKLRETLSRLPDLTAMQNRMASRAGRMRTAQNRKYAIEVELSGMETDPEGAAKKLLATWAPEAEVTSQRLEDAQLLVDQRREALDALKVNYETYIDGLTNVDEKEQQAVRTTTELRDFINGRMLWIRSHPSMLQFDSESTSWVTGERALWLFRPSSYAKVVSGLVNDFERHPVTYIIACVFLAVLLIGQQWLRAKIRQVSEVGRRRANVSVRPLLRTMAMTVADAAVWPGLLAFTAIRLQEAFATDPEIASAASTLVRVSIALFLTELVHDSCLAGGVAEMLGVPQDVAKYVRRKIFRLEILGAPLAILIAILHAENVALAMRGVERITFIIGMCLLARLANQMLRATSPVVRMMVSDSEVPWVVRFRPVFWAAGVFVPLGIAVLSLIGYHNTALQLCGKLELTVWLGLGLLTLRLILATAIMLHRRRIRFEEIRNRVAQSFDRTDSEQTASDVPATPSGLAASIGIEERENRETITSRMAGQSQRLIASIAGLTFLIGAYAIWNDVLPALDVITEWSPYSTQNGEKPITIGRILLAVVAIVVTATGARNLPGLLELSVLQRLGIDHSVRYAMTTILSYLISVLGLVIAGYLIGLTWSSLQWLAAGLTVGLGFGLQEIFANFISGLIIFFEQPIRVGDVVTLSDVTGVVSRIRMRATTITNWDRKEYIVPNKEFITGRLLNWTLTDTTNRLVLTVGVAYGSDTENVRNILLEIVSSHQHIMKEPAPLVTLEELGNSSVNFTIRCYLQALDVRLATTHEIYSEIHRRFIAEGIEIPFPQTDLHIRDIAPVPYTTAEPA